MFLYVFHVVFDCAVVSYVASRGISQKIGENPGTECLNARFLLHKVVCGKKREYAIFLFEMSIGTIVPQLHDVSDVTALFPNKT